ncbi:hypothetical protein BH10CYA1_BH10CYA1_14390 [soil metagenome]
MKTARLALIAVMPYIVMHSAAHAAGDTKTVTDDAAAQGLTMDSDSRGDGDQQGDEQVSKLTRLALGGMSDLGGFLTSDLPSPESRVVSSSAGVGEFDDKLAIGASDAAPSWGQHPLQTNDGAKAGQSSGGSCIDAPGMPHRGFGMKGSGSMWGHHYRCPWEKLEGANALTDEQYQKLYDIKGQFITSIVPKGLNVWMLGRKMRDLLNVADVDTSAVKDVEKQIAAATSDLSMTAMDSIISANQVLTPAQRKELHKMTIRSTLGGHGHHDTKDSQSDK